MSKRKINDDNNNINSKNQIDIQLNIEDLPVYKNFIAQKDTKIIYDSTNFTNLVPSEEFKRKISQYVFLFLFRTILLFDFMHDFCNTSREGNVIYNNVSDKNKLKKDLLKHYKIFYEKDLEFIKEIIFKFSSKTKDNQDKINITLMSIILNFDDQDVTLEMLTFDKLENYSHDKAQEASLKIIEYLDIKSVENLEDLSNINCSENLNSLLNSVDNINLSKIDSYNIFIDADKSKYSTFPIVMKICDLLFSTGTFWPTSKKKLTLQTSIVDTYDSATTSQLNKIIKTIQDKYKNYNEKKLGRMGGDVYSKLSIKNEKKNINMSIQFNDKELINLYFNNENYEVNGETIKQTSLKINRFFAVDTRLFNYSENNSSLNNNSGKIKQVLDDISPINKFINTFYKKSPTDKDLIEAFIPFYEMVNPNYNDFVILDKIQEFLNKYICVNNKVANNKNDFIENVNKIRIKKNEIAIDLNDLTNFAQTIYEIQVDNKLIYKYIDQFITHCKYDFSSIKHINIELETLIEDFKPIYNKLYSKISIEDFINNNNIKNELKKFMEFIVKFEDKFNKDKKYKNGDAFISFMVYYFSLYKSMGDFSQIIYCNDVTKKIANPNSISIFITFDKIASYISSLFNNITMSENYENPLMPMRLLTLKRVSTPGLLQRAWQYIPSRPDLPNLPNLPDLLKRQRNEFGKSKSSKSSKSSKQVVTYGIPKNELSKRRINSLISLAKKYKITLDNHTYKNLKRLYKLQVFAKSKRIPITYKNNNDVRKYKTLNRLEKEIKEYIKRTKHKK